MLRALARGSPALIPDRGGGGASYPLRQVLGGAGARGGAGGGAAPAAHRGAASLGAGLALTSGDADTLRQDYDLDLAELEQLSPEEQIDRINHVVFGASGNPDDEVAENVARQLLAQTLTSEEQPYPDEIVREFAAEFVVRDGMATLDEDLQDRMGDERLASAERKARWIARSLFLELPQAEDGVVRYREIASRIREAIALVADILARRWAHE